MEKHTPNSNVMHSDTIDRKIRWFHPNMTWHITSWLRDLKSQVNKFRTYVKLINKRVLKVSLQSDAVYWSYLRKSMGGPSDSPPPRTDPRLHFGVCVKAVPKFSSRGRGSCGSSVWSQDRKTSGLGFNKTNSKLKAPRKTLGLRCTYAPGSSTSKWSRIERWSYLVWIQT